MKLGIFIGRFQIFHNGHASVIKEALKDVDRLLVIVGSSNKARSLHDPFSFVERQQMIMQWAASDVDIFDNIDVVPMKDYENDLIWQAKIQKAVKDLAKDEYDEIFLCGHQKDNSSYYLKLFPQWGNKGYDNECGTSATDLRKSYFERTLMKDWPDRIPESTKKFLKEFSQSDEYIALYDEYKWIKEEKAKYEALEFQPTFNTTDPVVIQRGHILMVERGQAPGKGLWALPGGYVNAKDETLEDACIRELYEETKLKVPKQVLKAGICGSKTFDSVFRDPRGRFFTKAFMIKLRDDKPLEKVKGSDDAARAFWVPLGELNGKNCVADHFQIIWCMVNKFG